MADLWAFLQTLDDPCASLKSKVIMGMAVIGSVAGPGGGYGVAAKRVARTSSHFRDRLINYTGINPGQEFVAHHVLPKQFRRQFAAAGISNIHQPEYGTWWMQPEHSALHYLYNQEWKRFFRKGQPRSAAGVEAFARRLAKRYGFDVSF